MCGVRGSDGHFDPRGLGIVSRAAAHSLTDPTLFYPRPGAGVPVWRKAGDSGDWADDVGPGSARLGADPDALRVQRQSLGRVAEPPAGGRTRVSPWPAAARAD